MLKPRKPTSRPRHLSAEAATEWNRIMGLLHSGAWINPHLDRAVLAGYCQAYGRWVQSEALLKLMAADDAQNRGLLSQTFNGTTVQNSLIGVANKAMFDMIRYAAELGLTPKSRRTILGEQEAGAEPKTVGKREQQYQAALTAGQGTEWEEDLTPVDYLQIN